MKKNKGFTLVELISILTILGIIALITIPIMTKTINNAKIKALREQKTAIIEAAKKYALDIAEDLPKYDGDIYAIKVSDLRNSPYLDEENIIDPTTNKAMNGCVNIIYNGQKGKYSYTYVDACKTYASSPELDENMIPIVYRNNRWETVGNTRWYNYDNKEWANAAIVKDVSKYKNLDAGVEVLDDDIVAMFVWIPRYSYTIQKNNKNGETTYGYNSTNIATPGSIDIKFIDKNTTDDGVGYYYGTSASNFHTSDAFWNDYDNDGVKEDNEQLNGIWVGKFETGTASNSLCASNEGYPNCNKVIDGSELLIKSNTKSLRYQEIGYQFKTAFNLGRHYNLEAETRMMKSPDWGAITYLAQSVYGRCSTKETCTAITKNANQNFMTANGDYKANLDQSTTGNITGVYDVNGGSWEVSMSFYQSIPQEKQVPADIKPKYYNIYTSTDSSKACNGDVCYGYSLSETERWYNGLAKMTNSSLLFTIHGGDKQYEGGSGFAYYEHIGMGGNTSFRIVVQTK